jgi:hypothetical protein
VLDVEVRPATLPDNRPAFGPNSPDAITSVLRYRRRRSEPAPCDDPVVLVFRLLISACR